MRIRHVQIIGEEMGTEESVLAVYWISDGIDSVFFALNVNGTGVWSMFKMKSWWRLLWESLGRIVCT